MQIYFLLQSDIFSSIQRVAQRIGKISKDLFFRKQRALFEGECQKENKSWYCNI